MKPIIIVRIRQNEYEDYDVEYKERGSYYVNYTTSSTRAEAEKDKKTFIEDNKEEYNIIS